MLNLSAKKVQETLKSLGHDMQVVELPASTRTSAEAAQAVGCPVGQIAKSLVFRTAITSRPVLVVASGANRVDEGKIEALVGETVEKADADFVRERTGFAIGGVPPVGHRKKIEIYIDQDLLDYAEIWAAAGTPHAVFRLTPDELVRMTGGLVTWTK
jgi:prolyl-tRNA editing enzyme YbaK/EbsC (Cys-tRNA(Pro) deacylase)